MSKRTYPLTQPASRAALQEPAAYLELLKVAALSNRTELPFEDRYQEGWFGLHHALTHFEPTKAGTAFEPYALKCIKGFILGATAAHSRTIRVAESAFFAGVRVPCDSLEELAERAWFNECPLPAPEPEESGPTDAQIRVVEVLSTLVHREQLVLRLRYGFEGEQQTLAQVGKQLGVTREMVRQIEKQALGKLRMRLSKPAPATVKALAEAGVESQTDAEPRPSGK